MSDLPLTAGIQTERKSIVFHEFSCHQVQSVFSGCAFHSKIVCRSILGSVLSLCTDRHLLGVLPCGADASFQSYLMGCSECFQNYTQSKTFILSYKSAKLNTATITSMWQYKCCPKTIVYPQPLPDKAALLSSSKPLSTVSHYLEVPLC